MATIPDLSPKPKTATIFGNAAVSSGNGRFGAASLYCPNNGSYLYLDNNNDFNLSGNEYTIECWIKPSGDYSNYNTIIAKRSQASGCAWEVYLRISDGRLGFYNGTNYESSVTPVANIWSHVAAVYNSGTLKLYLNGSGVLTSNITNTNVNAPIYIGSYPPLNEQYKGYIDEVRITKGIGTSRYLTNFSRPIGPFPTTGTPISGPTSPTNPSTTIGNTSLSLSWSIPVDDNGDDISGYAVEYTPENNSPIYIQTNSTGLSYTLTGLSNGTSYSLRVAALNIAGTGLYSTTFSGIPATTPSVPSGLSYTSINSGLSLSWSEPFNGGRSIIDYIVRYSSGNTPTLLRTNSTLSSYSLTGLRNGVSYVVDVAAINVLGTGSYSRTITGIPATVPSAPTGLLLTSANSELNLSWFAPNNGGSSILDYVVQYSNDSGSNWTNYSDSFSSSTSVTITGLALNLSYIARVAAVNIYGTGLYSNSSNSVFLSSGLPCDLVASGLPTPLCDLTVSGLPDLTPSSDYVYQILDLVYIQDIPNSIYGLYYDIDTNGQTEQPTIQQQNSYLYDSNKIYTWW